MLDTAQSVSCAYQGCSHSGSMATLIIEIVGGRLERQVCNQHISMVPTITQEHQGLAYHLIPFQWWFVPGGEPRRVPRGRGGAARAPPRARARR